MKQSENVLTRMPLGQKIIENLIKCHLSLGQAHSGWCSKPGLGVENQSRACVIAHENSSEWTFLRKNTLVDPYQQENRPRRCPTGQRLRPQLGFVKITETDEFLSEENWLVKGVVAKEKPRKWLDTCVQRTGLTCCPKKAGWNGHFCKKTRMPTPTSLENQPGWCPTG
jgi:hypothetical protein